LIVVITRRTLVVAALFDAIVSLLGVITG
jgi:hypothetical protein